MPHRASSSEALMNEPGWTQITLLCVEAGAMPKQREEMWAKRKGSQPQHTKLRRAENDPNQPSLLQLFAGPLSAQLAFYGRSQLSPRRWIHRDTARTAALRLSKKIQNLTNPKSSRGDNPRSHPLESKS